LPTGTPGDPRSDLLARALQPFRTHGPVHLAFAGTGSGRSLTFTGDGDGHGNAQAVATLDGRSGELLLVNEVLWARGDAFVQTFTSIPVGASQRGEWVQVRFPASAEPFDMVPLHLVAYPHEIADCAGTSSAELGLGSPTRTVLGGRTVTELPTTLAAGVPADTFDILDGTTPVLARWTMNNPGAQPLACPGYPYRGLGFPGRLVGTLDISLLAQPPAIVTPSGTTPLPEHED
jgi:hypothetical protein